MSEKPKKCPVLVYKDGVEKPCAKTSNRYSYRGHCRLHMYHGSTDQEKLNDRMKEADTKFREKGKRK